MINNYGLFNHHDDDNTLVILLSDSEISERRKLGEVEVLLNRDRIVGYSIANFIRYAKIKYSGIIFLPSNALVDVINALLKDAGLETLNYKNNSGYAVKTGENAKKMVFAKPGTFLRDESISKGRFCSYYDLYINNENPHDLIVIDDDVRDDIDFFLMEEK